MTRDRTDPLSKRIKPYPDQTVPSYFKRVQTTILTILITIQICLVSGTYFCSSTVVPMPKQSFDDRRVRVWLIGFTSRLDCTSSLPNDYYCSHMMGRFSLMCEIIGSGIHRVIIRTQHTPGISWLRTPSGNGHLVVGHGCRKHEARELHSERRSHRPPLPLGIVGPQEPGHVRLCISIIFPVSWTKRLGYLGLSNLVM